MKIDCSVTKNFLEEWNRMCRKQQFCSLCPIGKYKKIASNCLFDIEENLDDAIKIVQTWSDRNQIEIDWNKVPMGTPVLVNDGLDDEWLERYFAMYLPDGYEKFCVFADGATYENAKTISCWKDCKLADNVDLTPFYKSMEE